MLSFDDVWTIVERVGGHLPHEDGRALYNACAMAHSNDPECRYPWVEVGSFIGRSANIIARFGHPTYLIDPHYLWQSWDKVKDGGPDVGWRYLEKRGAEDVKDMLIANTQGLPVTILSMESSEAQTRVPDRIGFVFIDGNHTEGGVDVDCDIWLPRLVPGGVAAFHDYDVPNYPLVTASVNRLTDWERVVAGGALVAMRKGR